MSIDQQLLVRIAARNETQRAFSELTGQLNGIKNTVLAVGAAIGSAFAFREVIDSTRRWGQEVNQLQSFFGLSADQASKLNVIAKSVGLTTDEVSNTFAILGKRIEDSAEAIMKGTSDFDKFGISLRDANGGIVSTEEAMRRVRARVQEMGQTWETTTLLQNVFGRSGKQLSDFLSLTDEEMQDMIQTGKDWGVVLDENGSAKLQKFNREMYKFENIILPGIKLQIGQFLIPLLTNLLERIRGVGGAFKVLGEAMRAPLGIMKAVIDRLREFAQQVKAEGFWAALISLASDLIRKIGEVLGNVGSWFAENFPKWRAALGQLWEDAKSFISGTLWPSLVQFLETRAPEFAGWIITSLPHWSANLGRLLGDILNWLATELVPGFLRGLNMIIEKLPDWIGGVANWFATQAWPAITNAVTTFVDNLLDGLLGPLDDDETGFAAGFRKFVVDVIRRPFEFVGGIFDAIRWIIDRATEALALLRQLFSAPGAPPGGGSGPSLDPGAPTGGGGFVPRIGPLPGAGNPYLGSAGGAVVNNIYVSVSGNVTENERVLADMVGDTIMRRLLSQRQLSF